MQCRTQRQAQAFARHRHQRPVRPSGRSLQVFSSPRGIIDDVALAGDHDVGRCVALQHARFDGLPQRAFRRLLGLNQAATCDAVAAKHYRQMRDGRAIFAPLEYAVLLVERGKQIAVLGDVLGRAKEQEPMRLERVVEDRDHACLQLAVEIDEEIAAGDQVHARERRIAHHAVRGEHAYVADPLVDHIAGTLGPEEALKPLF